jgi:WD40 repeat protein
MRVYVYNEKQTKEMLHFNYHTESVRQVVFSPDGNVLYTSSSDGSIGVVSNGKLEGQLTGAHPAPINSLIHIENNTVLASGDDDGMIKIWDLRQAASGKHAMKF